MPCVGEIHTDSGFQRNQRFHPDQIRWRQSIFGAARLAASPFRSLLLWVVAADEPQKKTRIPESHSKQELSSLAESSTRRADCPSPPPVCSHQRIDKCDKPNSLTPVPILRRIFAFALLALWLTATNHCGLEAAVMLDSQRDDAAASGCCASSQQCAEDRCDLVEQGSAVSSTDSVKVPMPALRACSCLVCLGLIAPPLLAEPLVEFTQGIDGPLGWVPTWHFARRAAQLPRAPSSILA